VGLDGGLMLVGGRVTNGELMDVMGCDGLTGDGAEG
jgi:hypothetical protein